jgi:hypothetical protein
MKILCSKYKLNAVIKLGYDEILMAMCSEAFRNMNNVTGQLGCVFVCF